MTDQTVSRLYSIGEVVADLQAVFPDVTQSSLRFLQRRGLLTPLRTAGGHRKYRESDLYRIRMIKSWQEERLSLEEIGARLEQFDTMPPATERWPRFLEDMLAGRLAEASAIVLSGDTVGVPLTETFEGVLMPALAEVGRRWAVGELRVDQEHEISELCRDLVSELTLRHMRTTTGGPVVLAAAVENERHDIGLRMVCGLLREAGVAIHFLGTTMPTELLLESMNFRRPDTLLLSITMEQHLTSLKDLLAGLRSSGMFCERPRVIVGGRASAVAADIAGLRVLVIPPDASLTRVVAELAAAIASDS